MNRLVLILVLLLFSGCSAFKIENAPITNPVIKDRPVFYSMPQASEYVPIGEISASARGGLDITCDALADTALDKLIDESREKGGHAVGAVSFSECSSGRWGRSVSVDGIALLNYKLLPPIVAGIGDVFFSHEDKYFRWDLTITELTSDRISFQYNEYTREGYYFSYPWLIKQGFNKTYSYQLADKTIIFREYEFDILNYTPGKITYKMTLPSFIRMKSKLR